MLILIIENEMQEKDMFAQSFRIGRLYKWAGPGSLAMPAGCLCLFSLSNSVVPKLRHKFYHRKCMKP